MFWRKIKITRKSSDDDAPRSTSNWEKFRLLMWKNFLLQWRSRWKAVAEILVPAVFTALLLYTRTIFVPETHDEPTVHQPFPVNNLTALRESQGRSVSPVGDWKLVYTPGNQIFSKLIGNVSDSLGLDGIIGVQTAHEVVLTMEKGHLVAGIEFHHDASITELPKKLSYSLRFPSEMRTEESGVIESWRTHALFPWYPTSGPRGEGAFDGGPPYYYREGFIPIQDAIARAFVGAKTNGSMPHVWLQRLPFPPYYNDNLLQGLKTIISFIILLSYVYPCINTVRYIAVEKEKQLKEAMKIMGLPNWLHWLGWFITSMVYMMISITLIVIILKLKMFEENVSVLTYADGTTLWAFFFVYSISTTTYCFALSVFFKKANTAAAAAGLIWFIPYFPFLLTLNNYTYFSKFVKLLLCLPSNTAMAYGIQEIVKFESTKEGLNWGNLFRPVTVDDDLTVGITMVMMLFASLVYVLIALYVEKVMPGEFGVPEPWNFPFKREFWLGVTEHHGVEDTIHDSQVNRENFEADPSNRHAGIRVMNLRKVYANKRVAVHGLTLNMFEDQITVLLGHNGAGKTTTMSVLTGMLQPTSGTAVINGYDIRTNMDEARGSIGFCPQHNILFDDLTVREHIEFYSRLKGLDAADVEEEVVKYVKLLELEPKIDAMSRTLSGGMKRKLSVCVALCGGSKVVLCDEPSSGMDPSARRALWDLLQLEKKGRTILLSTHFMDEADILGDRIAIMAGGHLKCSGTPFFLKTRFGTGYHLICVKEPECKSHKVTELLAKYIPNIEVESDIGTELSYQLPKSQIGIFEQMFSELESNRAHLRLAGYGVSLTTLEEVFHKVGSDNHNSNKSDDGSLDNSDSDSASVTTTSNPDFESSHPQRTVHLLRGIRLKQNQWYAMIKKKFIYSTRNWIMLILQNVIMIVFVWISVTSARTYKKQVSLPPLEISLEGYGKTVTMMENRTIATPPKLMTKVYSEYEKYVQSISSDAMIDVTDLDIQTYFLRLAETMFVRLNAEYMAGVTFGRFANDTIIAWFNSHPHHAAPLSMNLAHNAIVRAMIDTDHSISVINAPVPFTTSSEYEMLSMGIHMGFELAINISFAMAFVSAIYIIAYIKERESRAKLLQFVSGVNALTYWLASFLWDFCTFIVTAIITMITLTLFQENGWSTSLELGRLLFVLIIFGYAAMPLTFIASLIFSTPSSGFTRMAIFNILSGVAVFLVISTMLVPEFGVYETADRLKWIVLVFPHFTLSSCLNNMFYATMTEAVCQAQCDRLPICTPEILCAVAPQCCKEVEHLGWEEPGIGRNLLYMFITGTVCFIVLLIIEYRLLASMIEAILDKFKRQLPPETEDGYLDNDVLAEKQRVNAMSDDTISSTNLVIKKVSKFYGKFLAVNQVSLTVRPGECFGLLGSNGAGKTSTFKMLTGDERISDGDVWLRGISVQTQLRDVQRQIGYCPQFDALIEDLTGRETLEMFALLRGVPRNDINGVSCQLASELNFTKHIDKQVFEYSGGNKRKLSTAVALLGNPLVVYLDEPTSGMDPGARRNLWNALCKVRNAGTSIVLSSHSMEECEALCSRLAIMVNGEFKCIGSTQHLKNKFSKGYVLSVKVKMSVHPGGEPEDIVGELVRRRSQRISTYFADSSTKTAASNHALRVVLDKFSHLQEYIHKNFPGAILKEDFQGLLTYYVPVQSDLKWSRMFGLMEDAKKNHLVEDYSISQTTLEEVFLSFAQNQREDLRIA